MRILGLEVVGECVDEQHDFAAHRRALRLDAAVGVDRSSAARNVSRRHVGNDRCAENPSHFSVSAAQPGIVLRRLSSHGSRAPQCAQRGRYAIKRSLNDSPRRRC